MFDINDSLRKTDNNYFWGMYILMSTSPLDLRIIWNKSSCPDDFRIWLNYDVFQVFGDVAVPGMDKDIKDAMSKGTKGIEKLMGSQTSLNRRVSCSRETLGPAVLLRMPEVILQWLSW